MNSDEINSFSVIRYVTIVTQSIEKQFFYSYYFLLHYIFRMIYIFCLIGVDTLYDKQRIDASEFNVNICGRKE